MKYAPLLCVLCLLLLANTCRKKETIESALTGKTWLHSYEEDEGEIMVFRPNTFDFPPSRGRTGFALEPGGIIKQYEIAPTDGLEEQLGKWEMNDKDQIEVQMEETSVPPQKFTLVIVSLKDEVLKVRRQQPQEQEQN